MHDTHNERMSGRETRAASGLALVFAFRMLGMFMVLPVLATYGQAVDRESAYEVLKGQKPAAASPLRTFACCSHSLSNNTCKWPP